ncbi:MAG: flavin reductase [Clostridia bacterium]|nr:flavin reductase [Clostridia bacterium]
MSTIDTKALFNISYGLYVVTSNDGKKHNGLIVNTVMQLTDTPNRVGVCINKANYSHDVIKQTGIMNINCLTESTPFETFKRFGFQSGKDADKFSGESVKTSENGLAVLGANINAFISLKVASYVDLDTHGLFICDVTEAQIVSDEKAVTYTYYQENIKPKTQAQKKKGYVCKICGYVYEGENLPEDFICPWCKHGASDFEELK